MLYKYSTLPRSPTALAPLKIPAFPNTMENFESKITASTHF